MTSTINHQIRLMWFSWTCQLCNTGVDHESWPRYSSKHIHWPEFFSSRNLLLNWFTYNSDIKACILWIQKSRTLQSGCRNFVFYTVVEENLVQIIYKKIQGIARACTIRLVQGTIPSSITPNVSTSLTLSSTCKSRKTNKTLPTI